MTTITDGRFLKPSARFTHRTRVVSRRSGRTYTIAKNAHTGEWSCSCRGWIFHRHCRHLTEFLAR